MKLMDEASLSAFAGLVEFGPEVDGEKQGPWEGEVKVRLPGGKVVEAMILVGQNDNGDAVNVVMYYEGEGQGEPVELTRLVASVTALKRAKTVEAMGTVDLLDLGRLGYKARRVDLGQRVKELNMATMPDGMKRRKTRKVKTLLDGREKRRVLELRDLARQYADAVEMEDQPKKEQLSRLMEGFEPGATRKVLEKVNSGEEPDSVWPAP